MISVIFDSNCFNTPSSEQMIRLWIAAKNSYSDLHAFSKACAQNDYLQMKDFIAADHTWEKRQSIFDIYNISMEKFNEYLAYKDELKHKADIIIQGEIINALHIYSDWDCAFCTAQTNELYYGFIWETSA